MITSSVPTIVMKYAKINSDDFSKWLDQWYGDILILCVCVTKQRHQYSVSRAVYFPQCVRDFQFHITSLGVDV